MIGAGAAEGTAHVHGPTCTGGGGGFCRLCLSWVPTGFSCTGVPTHPERLEGGSQTEEDETSVRRACALPWKRRSLPASSGGKRCPAGGGERQAGRAGNQPGASTVSSGSSTPLKSARSSVRSAPLLLHKEPDQREKAGQPALMCIRSSVFPPSLSDPDHPSLNCPSALWVPGIHLGFRLLFHGRTSEKPISNLTATTKEAPFSSLPSAAG